MPEWNPLRESIMRKSRGQMNIPYHQKPCQIRLGQTVFKLINLIFITSLVSCGGSGKESDFSVGGTVTGLQGSVTLRNRNADVLTLNSSGSFKFDEKLNNDSSYSVDVRTQPSNQICRVSNASGIISDEDVVDVSVVCAERVTLSGSYQAAPLIQVDSDINDATAKANVSNGIPNSISVAQTIPNFSTVHGFATKVGTGRISANDRFADSGDEVDVYRVNLQANQTIRLQVVDFSGVDEFKGDLDLALYDSAFNLLDFSVGGEDEEFENVKLKVGQVTEDGTYYIIVNAFEGSSKYTLSLNAVSPANVSYQSSTDFRLGEAVIQFKSNATLNNVTANRLVLNSQSMQLSHTKTTRASLAKFDVSSNSNISSLSKAKTKPDFMEELKQKNYVSYQKIKTLQQIKRLKQRADIKYAEPNYIYKPLLVPDDAFYNRQWHYPAINLPQAWDITTGTITATTGDRVGTDVIVAVIDTGVFLNHPEFAGQLVSGYDFISDAANAADGESSTSSDIDDNPDDPGDSAQINNSSWHGTHVAGTIAARTNNGEGVAGVAWQAKIMPLRALGTLGGLSFDIIQAVLYAAGLPNSSGTLPAQKADIINLSLGGAGDSQASQDAYTAARNAGVIIVAAAGNENTSQLSYPASYDGVVSVSATGFDDNRAPYSNFGSKIDIAAPGGSQGVDLNNDGFGDGVLSTLVDDSSGSREATFKFYQGTSMATPHVAGVFALMRAVYPALSPDDIDALLVLGVITTDLGATGRDDTYGHGLVDALKAVQEAQRLAANDGELPPPPPLIISTPKQLTLGATNGATLVVSNESITDAQVTSVDVDASWLIVTEDNVDANKLGMYEVSIDRAGLNDPALNDPLIPGSFYLGTITFNLSTSASVQVQVSMSVGSVSTVGDAGTIYLLLVDADNNVIDDASVDERGNGVYDYSFTNASAGSYRIIGGSDIDNDTFICQLAEACGGYPTINALSVIEVGDSDITGLDFVVDILANFGAGSLSDNSLSAKDSSSDTSSIAGKIGGAGIRRIINRNSNLDLGSDSIIKNKQLVK